MTGRGEIGDDSRECVLTELCGCWAPNAGVPPPPKGCDIGRGRGRWSVGTGWVGPGLTRVGLEVFIIQSERRSVFEMAGAPKTAGRGLTDAAPPPPNIALALTSLRQQGEIR